jgi:FkbM family methyltransferase
LNRRAGWIIHVLKSSTRNDHLAWQSTLRRVVSEDGTAIDVGAHGGQFTQLLAGIVHRGHVIAIEPSSYARSVLTAALWVRRVSNVTVVQTALGAAHGVAMLDTPIKKAGDMGYGLAHIAAGSEDAGGERVREPVTVTTLDALVDTLRLPRVDFIKADVEGYEAALIAGARRTLKRHRPPLLLEHDARHLARAGSSLNQLWVALIALGYRPHILVKGDLVSVRGDEPVQGDVLWLANTTQPTAYAEPR